MTPAFLSDTGVSSWHQRSLLTLAFLTDPGVSFWHRRFLLTLTFLSDTGVSYWLTVILSPASYRKQSRWDRLRSSLWLPLSLWQLHCGCRASCQSLNTWIVCTKKGTFFFKLKISTERVQSHQYIREKLRKSVIFVCVYYIVKCCTIMIRKVYPHWGDKLIHNAHSARSRTLLFIKSK